MVIIIVIIITILIIYDIYYMIILLINDIYTYIYTHTRTKGTKQWMRWNLLFHWLWIEHSRTRLGSIGAEASKRWVTVARIIPSTLLGKTICDESLDGCWWIWMVACSFRCCFCLVAANNLYTSCSFKTHSRRLQVVVSQSLWVKWHVCVCVCQPTIDKHPLA